MSKYYVYREREMRGKGSELGNNATLAKSEYGEAGALRAKLTG